MEREHQHLNEEEIQTYLDGFADEEWLADVEARLASCDVCSARVDAWQAMFAALEDLPEETLTISLRNAVLDRIRPANGYEQPVYLLAVEAFAVLSLAVYIWVNRSSLILTAAHYAADLTGMIARFPFRFDAFPGASFLERIALPDMPSLTHLAWLAQFASLSTLIAVAVLAFVLLVVVNRSLLRPPNQRQS